MGGTICRSRHPDQVSRSMLPLPWIYVNQFIKSAEIAEEALGEAPTVLQIFKVLQEIYDSPVANCFELAAVLCSILREDLIFVDKICAKWTVHKREGFFSYSELFKN